MARLNGNAILGGINLPIPQGTEVELVDAVDNGLSRFNVIWHTPKGPIKGPLAIGLLDLTQQEIADQDIPTDRNGLPLYRDRTVIYVGQSNGAVTNGDLLIVRDLWYNGSQLECQCLHQGNARPNTDGRVVVSCGDLESR